MKPPKVPSLVSIAILTAITLVFWAFFSAYRIFTVKPPIKVSPEVVAPLTPSLDKSALEKIDKTIFFSP